MNNAVWLNLPSSNLSRSQTFYKAIGFEMNEGPSNDKLFSMVVGSNRLIVNIFDAKVLSEAMGNQPITDTSKSNETIISLGAASVEELELFTKRAREAGAKIFAEPAWKDGWLYGSGFVDLDGHRWNYLYMDMTKRPK